MSDEKKQPYDWCYENSINSKVDYRELGVPGDPKYEPFRTNRSFSNHPDTIQNAQFCNMNYGLDAKLQYDYLFYSIRKKKRTFKTRSKATKDEHFALVQGYFKYSNKKTYEALAILSEEQLAIIKRKMDRGGIR